MATSGSRNFFEANSSSVSDDPIMQEYCQFISSETKNTVVIDLVDSSDEDSIAEVSSANSPEKGFRGSDEIITETTSNFVNLMDSSSDSDAQYNQNNRSKSKKIRKKLMRRKKDTTSHQKSLSLDNTSDSVQEPRIRIASSSDEEEWNDDSINFSDESFDLPTNISITTIPDDGDDGAHLETSDDEDSQLDDLISRTKRLNMADSDKDSVIYNENNKENGTRKRKPRRKGARPKPIVATKQTSHLVNINRTPQKCRDFRKTRESLAQTVFKIYNQSAFDGKLGSVEVIWSNKLRTTAGLTRLRRISKLGRTREERLASIELSLKVLDDEERLRSTLLHEMVHCAAWIIDGISKPPHGSCFKKWARLAMKRIPGMTVTTTHDYEIQYKYAWVRFGSIFCIIRVLDTRTKLFLPCMRASCSFPPFPFFGSLAGLHKRRLHVCR